MTGEVLKVQTIVRSSGLSVNESAGVPLTEKSLASTEAGSIGSEKGSGKSGGAVPTTTSPAAGTLEITVGAISKWETQVAQLAGKPESSDVEYSAPLQNVPSTGSTPMPL